MDAPLPGDAVARAYDRWRVAIHAPAISRRTAAANAAFFLPHLTPGISLLDLGCGPGSITAGLAQVVAPGAVTGLDINPATVASARAAYGGTPGLSFTIGDASAVPFADATFDAVFAHALLQHAHSPSAVLREAFRVLRPGGVVGIADADHGGSLIAPETPTLRASLDLMVRVQALRGGDYQVGRSLGLLLAEAGFTDISVSAAGGCDGTPAVKARAAERQARILSGEPFAAFVEAAGLETRARLTAMAEAWRTWATTPGSLWTRWWFQATAVRGNEE
ncbi:MAG: methyltransferase domain-containing protein [Dehalococcoidia bacterium]|nr:methyltransferase domain-containing protein [Dehalococcoidia bacterium]